MGKKYCSINNNDGCQKKVIDGCNKCQYYVSFDEETNIKERKIKEFSTKELVEELRKREGVKSMDVTPDNSYSIEIENDFEDIEIDETGLATILIVTD